MSKAQGAMRVAGARAWASARTPTGVTEGAGGGHGLDEKLARAVPGGALAMAGASSVRQDRGAQREAGRERVEVATGGEVDCGCARADRGMASAHRARPEMARACTVSGRERVHDEVTQERGKERRSSQGEL